MESDTIHLHRSRVHHPLNVFLLFIPAIVFTLAVLFYLVSKNFNKETSVASYGEPNILGKDVTNP